MVSDVSDGSTMSGGSTSTVLVLGMYCTGNIVSIVLINFTGTEIYYIVLYYVL